jgi:Domain of unknown function (DUF2804), C-terminal
MATLPQRGPGLRDLKLPVPPDPMPGWRGTRPLKRWRYLGVFCDEVMLCVGEARVGPLPQRFWAVIEPGGPVTDRTTIGRGGVRIDGSHFHVDARGVRIDLDVDEDDGVESIHPSGRDGYVWTRKQGGVQAHGEVRVGARMYSLACPAVVDDTAGYHQRHTSWIWSAGVGRGSAGEKVAWNLVTGVNDSERDSERAIWVDGEPSEPGPVTFAPDLSSVGFAEGGELSFSEWAAREDRTNILLIRSSYRQPFGTFSGTLPGGVQLEQGFGVVEVHDVHW